MKYRVESAIIIALTAIGQSLYFHSTLSLGFGHYLIFLLSYSSSSNYSIVNLVLSLHKLEDDIKIRSFIICILTS